MHTTTNTAGLSKWLTPNYRATLNDPARYNATLATILRDAAAKGAQERQPAYRRLNLAAAAPVLERAAREAADLIAAHPAPAPATLDRNKQLALRGDAIGDTYCRELSLFEAGHLDDLETQLAGEILARAQARVPVFSQAGVNTTGFALLDMFLREAVNAIKPLLATQTNIELLAA